MTLTNIEGVSLSVALWLADDTYDHNENSISATSLIKAVRKTILTDRANKIAQENPDQAVPADVMDNIASSWGTALHDSIENTWLGMGRATALNKLGIPTSVVKRIKVNPTPEDFKANPKLIPIYMELRTSKKVGTYLITGKFDFVGQGRLEDFKATGTYKFVHGSSDWEFILQGSIYRWLNPEIITEDHMLIQFLFTDWSKASAIQGAKNGYPQHRLKSKKFDLMSIAETDKWVKERLAELTKFWNAPEEELPLCEERDLWRSKAVFKYYKKGVISARSTKNYPNAYEAQERLIDDGSVGLVVEKKGEVKACKFCNGFPLCTQKDAFIVDGSLII